MAPGFVTDSQGEDQISKASSIDEGLISAVSFSYAIYYASIECWLFTSYLIYSM